MKLIKDEAGEVLLPYSISAGLDYPGAGPEHCYYDDIGRAEYPSATDEQALEALITLSKLEGIIPALESAHAISYVLELAPKMDKDQIIVATVSGRGDKDMETLRNYEKNKKGK